MLEIKNIKKIYDNNKGLNNMSFILKSKEILCLIGPNGSGKSTALNIISGLEKPQEGECFLNGISTLDIKSKSLIGFLEEEPFYYGNISIIDFLNFIWGIKFKNVKNNSVYELLKKFDLLNIKDFKMKELSMGLRKRVGIISAIMNYPSLIILDEPTNGLDTKSIIMLKDELLNAKEHNSCIIVSSHILDFLKDISTRFIFIKDGYIHKDIINNDEINLDDVYRTIYL